MSSPRHLGRSSCCDQFPTSKRPLPGCLSGLDRPVGWRATCPCGIPVPAYLPVSVDPQCKRPPPSLLLTNGVHPCSLRTKTNVSSKAISWFQVLHQGRKDLVKRGAESGRSSWQVVRMHIPSGLHRSMFIPKQKGLPHTCRHKSSTGQGSLSEQGISVFFP